MRTAPTSWGCSSSRRAPRPRPRARPRARPLRRRPAASLVCQCAACGSVHVLGAMRKSQGHRADACKRAPPGRLPADPAQTLTLTPAPALRQVQDTVPVHVAQMSQNVAPRAARTPCQHPHIDASAPAAAGAGHNPHPRGAHAPAGGAARAARGARLAARPRRRAAPEPARAPRAQDLGLLPDLWAVPVWEPLCTLERRPCCIWASCRGASALRALPGAVVRAGGRAVSFLGRTAAKLCMRPQHFAPAARAVPGFLPKRRPWKSGCQRAAVYDSPTLIPDGAARAARDAALEALAPLGTLGAGVWGGDAIYLWARLPPGARALRCLAARPGPALRACAPAAGPGSGERPLPCLPMRVARAGLARVHIGLSWLGRPPGDCWSRRQRECRVLPFSDTFAQAATTTAPWWPGSCTRTRWPSSRGPPAAARGTSAWRSGSRRPARSARRLRGWAARCGSWPRRGSASCRRGGMQGASAWGAGGQGLARLPARASACSGAAAHSREAASRPGPGPLSGRPPCGLGEPRRRQRARGAGDASFAGGVAAQELDDAAPGPQGTFAGLSGRPVRRACASQG